MTSTHTKVREVLTRWSSCPFGPQEAESSLEGALRARLPGDFMTTVEESEAGSIAGVPAVISHGHYTWNGEN